jgi:hypothetical protein
MNAIGRLLALVAVVIMALFLGGIAEELTRSAEIARHVHNGALLVGGIICGKTLF